MCNMIECSNGFAKEQYGHWYVFLPLALIIVSTERVSSIATSNVSLVGIIYVFQIFPLEVAYPLLHPPQYAQQYEYLRNAVSVDLGKDQEIHISDRKTSSTFHERS